MAKEEIKEENINLDTEIGGNMFDWLKTEEITEPTEYECIEINQDRVISKTGKDYGKRFILCLSDKNGYGYKLSDWNFCTKNKVKLSELLGRKLLLKPYTEKKVIIEII